ncbi:MAG: hypothetical protein J4N31_00680, partial [Chloroflexi bacterium]|nr:hypothetical protein [Chloroflexota bacterium]
MDTEDTGLSLAEYAQMLWKRRWLIVLPLVLGFAGAIFFTTTLTPRYRTEAVLQVNAAAIRPGQMDPFSGLFLSREAVPTFIELMKTPPILNQVA